MEEKRMYSPPIVLKTEDFAMGDPFLKRMLKLNASPVILGSTIAILLTAIRMIAAWGSGTLTTMGNTIGFFDAPGMYINLIAGVVVWTYYIWVPQGITNVFLGLLERQVVGISQPSTKVRRSEDYAQSSFLRELQHSFNRRIGAVTALILSTGGTLIFLLPKYLHRMQIQDSWSMANPWNLVLSVLWAITGLYAALLVLFFIVLSIIWLRRLFTDFKVEVRPLHPDHAGGLSPLGKFSLNLSYIITLLGFILATIPISRYYLANGTFGFSWTSDVILGLGIYILAAPFAFFAPLSVAHAAMKGTKERLLLEISQRFEKEYAAIQESIQGDIKEVNTNMENLRGLYSLYELTSEFPVWPFNIENILRFITSFVSPILLVILSTIIRSLI
jgi:hypothetical protein